MKVANGGHAVILATDMDYALRLPGITSPNAHQYNASSIETQKLLGLRKAYNGLLFVSTNSSADFHPTWGHLIDHIIEPNHDNTAKLHAEEVKDILACKKRVIDATDLVSPLEKEWL
jgi:hypothetical protein